MPTANGKKFPYTAKGRADAKKEAAKGGKKGFVPFGKKKK